MPAMKMASVRFCGFRDAGRLQQTQAAEIDERGCQRVEEEIEKVIRDRVLIRENKIQPVAGHQHRAHASDPEMRRHGGGFGLGERQPEVVEDERAEKRREEGEKCRQEGDAERRGGAQCTVFAADGEGGTVPVPSTTGPCHLCVARSRPMFRQAAIVPLCSRGLPRFGPNGPNAEGSGRAAGSRPRRRRDR
jgi:hypothetical protein